MRITDLSLAGQGAWPELQLEALKPQLNVLFGQPRTGKSTVAQLVSHLLYGKPASAWRQQFGPNHPTRRRLADREEFWPQLCTSPAPRHGKLPHWKLAN